MTRLPHRYPMLLIDRVELLEPKQRIRAVKAVTFNEPFFQGHFPGRPVMPGVLIIEALAQAGVLLMQEAWGVDAENALIYFMAIDKAKFRAPVEPGVLLALEVEMVQIRERQSVCKAAGKAYVEDKLVAQAELTAMLTDKRKIEAKE